jgi:heptosyltransferase-3
MCSPALGDTLLFSAALQDLRAAFPAAHITHLCFAENLAAAEIIPGADERLLLNLTSPLASIRILRAQRLDVLLDFTSWQRLTACFTLFAAARYTVGFRSAASAAVAAMIAPLSTAPIATR